MEKNLFSTKLSKIDLLTTVIYIGFGFYFLYRFRNIFLENALTKEAFILLIPLLFFIQGIRIAKIFVLFSDRIIIRRPFLFTKIFDVVYKFDELKDVTFKTVKARGINDLVIFHTKISTYKTDESYILNDRNQMKFLINELENLNVKTINELN